MIGLLILSFIAGALTVLAPCILPLLPIIVGGAALQNKPQNQWYRPLVITASLAVSVVVFSLLLKATTALLGVPQAVWNIISGGIILLFGLSLLVPIIWEKLAIVTGFYNSSNTFLNASYKRKGLLGDILLGAALGPVFSSCSPTYALIVATILPQSFGEGLIYLVAYAAGLSAMLLLIAIVGQTLVKKLGWAANPKGLFRKIIGIVFIIVGIAVVLGLDKSLQAYILQQGWYDPIIHLEQSLRI